jgi:hypothetical protein
MAPHVILSRTALVLHVQLCNSARQAKHSITLHANVTLLDSVQQICVGMALHVILLQIAVARSVSTYQNVLKATHSIT